jgi:hypothetical protein
MIKRHCSFSSQVRNYAGIHQYWNGLINGGVTLECYPAVTMKEPDFGGSGYLTNILQPGAEVQIAYGPTSNTY